MPSRFLSLSAYAALCGLSRQVIYHRCVNNRGLAYETHKRADGTPYLVVNTETYPPDQQPGKQRAGRPRTRPVQSVK